jgi:hypothetical protein
MKKKLKEYKVLVWINVQTYDERDGFGDYQNLELRQYSIVDGYSEQDVRAHWGNRLIAGGGEYVLEEVK